MMRRLFQCARERTKNRQRWPGRGQAPDGRSTNHLCNTRKDSDFMYFIPRGVGRLLPRLPRVSSSSSSWFLRLKLFRLPTGFLNPHVVPTSSVAMSYRFHPGRDISRRGCHPRLIHDRGYSHGRRSMLRGIVRYSCTPPP